MTSSQEKFASFREKLAQVSPSFCSAKWLQVTLHLHNGHNHSCHHPATHKTAQTELLDNPSSLHNSSQKKEFRKQMLHGERPAECQYCWNVEDLPGNQISDRVIKSADHWAAPHLERIAKTPWNQNVSPTYVEVSFSNTCNFKCAYCFPHIS